MEENTLKYKTYQFSLSVVKLLEIMPRNYIYQTLGKQLLRAGTSIGANIIEAQAGRTRRDFINYYHIALKSANETKYWLSMMEDLLKVEPKAHVGRLLINVIEISKMLTASLITLKGKRNY